jgi:hypothetical protein
MGRRCSDVVDPSAVDRRLEDKGALALADEEPAHLRPDKLAQLCSVGRAVPSPAEEDVAEAEGGAGGSGISARIATDLQKDARRTS